MPKIASDAGSGTCCCSAFARVLCWIVIWYTTSADSNPSAGGTQADGEDVVDAEFEDVDENQPHGSA